MKRATNINEFVNNVTPARTIGAENREQYVPLFDRMVQKMRDKLIGDVYSESQTLYVAGQSGTGKSTTLKFLPDEAVEKKFATVFINGRDLFDMNDVEIVEVLILLGQKLIEGRPALLKKFSEDLHSLALKAQGMLEEGLEKDKSENRSRNKDAQFSMNLGFLGVIKSGASYYTGLRTDKKTREYSRQIFAFKKSDLFEMVNSIIKEYESRVIEGRKLLIIFNDFDHQRNVDQIQALFVDNRYFLEGLRCKKIISIPVHLTTTSGFSENCYFFGLKMKNNPLNEIAGDRSDEVTKNRALMRSIVDQRTVEGHSIYTSEIIDTAITSSGGIIRQFLEILYEAGAIVRSQQRERISIQDLDEAIREVTQKMERKIISNDKISLLKEVKDRHTPSTSESQLFVEALLGNEILIYNNAPTWYEVNPLIERTVEIYAKARSKADK